MKNIIILLLFFFSVSFAQVEKNIAVYRGDSTAIEFKVNGNITNKGIVFVVKLTKSFSSARLIQKSNLIAGGSAAEITASFSAPQTKVTVYLGPEDTEDLEATTYYYDIIAADGSNLASYQTFNFGKFTFTNGGDVQTPFDGTTPPTSGVRFYVAGTFIDSTVADSTLFRYDETTHSIVPIAKEDVWSFLSVSDTVETKIAEEMLDFKNYSLTFLYPTTNEDVLIDRTHRALTIDSIFCSTKDSSIAFNIYYASTRNGSTTGVFSSNQTITTPTTLTSFANATIPAGRYLIFQFSTVAGLVREEFYAKIYYRF